MALKWVIKSSQWVRTVHFNETEGNEEEQRRQEKIKKEDILLGPTHMYVNTLDRSGFSTAFVNIRHKFILTLL